MQSKGNILMSMLLFLAFYVMGQNHSLQEIKLDEFGEQAFVGLDGVMEDKQIFMWGEDFEKELYSNKFELGLIQYLIKNEGIRGLLFEEGIAKMHLVNQYINGGEIEYLEMLSEEIRDRDYKFYQALRKMNDSLPANNKVQIYGVRADENLEHQILYIYESLDPSLQKDFDEYITKNFPFEDFQIKEARIFHNTLSSDAQVIYNKYNFNDKLKKEFQFISVQERIELTKESLISPLMNTSINFAIFRSLEIIKNYISHYKYENSQLVENINSADHFKEFISFNPNTKFYAHFPWCNLERDQVNRNCGVYAYGEFIKHKDDLKVFSVMSLALNPNSYFTYDKKFNTQINTCIEKGYRYAGIGNKDDLIDYVFFTRNTYLKNRSTSVLKEKSYDKYVAFYANYGVGGYVNNDVSELNNSIQRTHPNFSGFKTGLGLKFVDLTVDYSRKVFKISHRWTNDPPNLISNTISVEFNQNSTTIYGGYNLVNNRKVMFAPMIGIGHANSNLTYISGGDTTNYPFTDTKTLKYTNPGLILDYMVDMNIVVFNFVGVGAKVGYVMDLSNKSWRGDAGLMSNSPDFSNAGFHAEFSVFLSLNKILK